MSDHTPGPWSIWQPHGPDFRSGQVFIMGATPKDEREVAPMVCAIQVDEPDRVESTARLVAAAPEMLSVCRSLVDVAHAEHGGEMEMLEALTEVYDAALAAISKAEGVSDA